MFSARDQRRVAVVEVVSPGNKDSAARAGWFESELVDYLAAGLHLLLLDLLPATEPAPGIAQAVARELGAPNAVPAEGRCTTSFELRSAPSEVRLYHRSLSLGERLPNAPLFLEPGLHVEVPLEHSYQEAFGWLPRLDQDRLSG